MNAGAVTMLAIIGLVGGSFVSVAVTRMAGERRRSIVLPASACPGCGHVLSALENLPLLGFALAGGKCRGCGQAIGWMYPALELACAGALVAAYAHAGLGAALVPAAYLLLSLVALAATDLRDRELPDEITLTGIVVGMALAHFTGLGYGQAALGAAAGGGVLALIAGAYYLVRRQEGLGWGDFKMLAMVGAFTGPAGALLTLALASGLGSAAELGLGAVLLAGRRRHGRAGSWKGYFSLRRAPLGVYLAVAAAVSWQWGTAMIRWYMGMWR